MYRVEIVEGAMHGPAEPAALEALLNSLIAQRFEIQFVLPNGVNRWTVIARRGLL